MSVKIVEKSSKGKIIVIVEVMGVKVIKEEEDVVSKIGLEKGKRSKKKEEIDLVVKEVVKIDMRKGNKRSEVRNKRVKVVEKEGKKRELKEMIELKEVIGIIGKGIK